MPARSLRQRVMVGAVGAALVLTGCDGNGGADRADRDPAGAQSDTTTQAGQAGEPTITTAPTPNGGPAPTSSPPAPGTAGASGASTTAAPADDGYRPPDFADPNNNRELLARIAPQCVEHGTTVTFDIRFASGGNVAARVKYPNDQFSELPSSTGTVGRSGVYTWRLEIPARASAGTALLLVAARISGNGHASGSFEFAVAAPGGC